MPEHGPELEHGLELERGHEHELGLVPGLERVHVVLERVPELVLEHVHVLQQPGCIRTWACPSCRWLAAAAGRLMAAKGARPLRRTFQDLRRTRTQFRETRPRSLPSIPEWEPFAEVPGSWCR